MRKKRAAAFGVIAIVSTLCISTCICSGFFSEPEVVTTIKSVMRDGDREVLYESPDALDTFPDWAFYASARMSPDEFQELVERLNLKPREDCEATEEQKGWISWRIGQWLSPSWWHPSGDLSGTYCDVDGDVTVLCKLEDGIMYYTEFSH
ncbi:MAG: hypothetical protein KF708_23075 [Pirellulales bacterium]|nr:hypothetical protein [Pirellulales bacterium]